MIRSCLCGRFKVAGRHRCPICQLPFYARRSFICEHSDDEILLRWREDDDERNRHHWDPEALCPTCGLSAKQTGEILPHRSCAQHVRHGGRVWGASSITPELLQAQAEENARQALKIDARGHARPNFYGPGGPWGPSHWYDFALPALLTLQNIARRVRASLRRS